jgi:putative selenate reductase
LRDLDFATRVSDTLTLSTFHGCPPHEIEAMVEHLMREHGLSCVVKLNPTLLGATEARHLLHDALGYRELRIPDDAFTKDANWEQATAFMDRLGGVAQSLGLHLGVKFSNTLIVENHKNFFPASEKNMYLSGPPLHVLAMHLVQRWRRAFGDRFPVSFSAGIERANFPDAVALGLVPVTVCTDLLQAGGYWRGFGYFEELGNRMNAVGATTIDEFIVRAYGDGGPTDLGAAKLRNTDQYVDRVSADPRYHAESHSKGPRKIGRRLQFFDCVTCNKCIPVCPNDANFSVSVPSTPELPLKMKRQIVNFADFCNDCGNCDVFCLEDGGPYLLKPRLFVNRERWLQDAPRDAVLIEPDAISGRFDGLVLHVVAGETASDDPRAQALRSLHRALLDPLDTNHVNEFLHCSQN